MHKKETRINSRDIRYSTRNPISRRLVSGFYKTIKRYLAQIEAKSVLEVGCGEGFVLEAARDILSPKLMIGSDYSDEWVARARDMKRNVNLLVCDARKIPFKEESLDLVLAIEALEHIENPEAALREIARVTSKWALLSVPNGKIWRIANMARGKYWAEWGNTPGHVNEWNSTEFLAFTLKYFQVVQSSTPFPWVVTLLKKK